MSWFAVRGALTYQLSQQPPPHFLVIHAGGNDLTTTPTSELCVRIENDVHTLAKDLPHCTIIWSDILPRLQWRGCTSVTGIERKRKRVNRIGRQAVLSVGGRVVKHVDITYDCAGLFRADGVHLEDIGNAIFLNTLQGALETFVVGHNSPDTAKLIFE
ncbi:hypothetical protein KP79_PYT19784 [Mizuhopecten yessoensis]|uniref:SGNH hydrolase-type esterase domain-containing protein n=1 Tax=Mizuhopecten yessoensis TaxID=6573 RepID=A0A210Q5H6_MIZYE|nr:hypothetical protein KP79_PYT19784 [Mizuhopecten yessoensis]